MLLAILLQKVPYNITVMTKNKNSVQTIWRKAEKMTEGKEKKNEEKRFYQKNETDAGSDIGNGNGRSTSSFRCKSSS